MGYGRHERRRGAATHFRRVVPKDIRARLGRREIVRSIGVLPASERHSMCGRFGWACDEVFRIVRSQTTLSRAEIDQLVTVYIDEAARRDREYESWRPRRSPEEGAFHRQTQIKVYGELAGSIMAGRRSRAGIVTTEALDAAAREAGVTIGSDLDAHLAEDALTAALALYYERRAEELRREEHVGAVHGVVGFLRRLLGVRDARVSPEARRETETPRPRPPVPAPRDDVSNEGRAPARVEPEATALAVEPPAEPMDISPAVEKPETNLASATTPSIGTFGTFWDEFVETKIEIRKDWKPSRRPELLSTRRLWIWIVGDLPIDGCGSDQVRRFQDSYLLLPEDYAELRKGKNGMLSPAEVIAAAKTRAERQANQKRSAPNKYQRVHAKTFNKHLSNLKAFFAWPPVAKSRPAGGADPTQGFHIAVDKSTPAVRAERRMAPVEAIRELFESPYWTGRSSTYFLTQPGDIIVRDSMYWIPLIVAFHGLRREEISQLRVRHIKSEPVGTTAKGLRIWYFDLTARDLELKEPDGGSPRRVPFHRQFEKLGFWEDKIEGRRDDELLFPELSNENAHSAFGESIGKRFGNYVNNIKFSDKSFNEALTLQAMRHTVRTLLDNTDAKEVYVDELLGHESEGRRSEGRRYRKGIDVANLKASIDLLDLAIDTERLRALASSKQSVMKGG